MEGKPHDGREFFRQVTEQPPQHPLTFHLAAASPPAINPSHIQLYIVSSCALAAARYANDANRIVACRGG